MHLLAPTPVSQWVSGSVGDSFRFGDSYRISELCELVFVQLIESIICYIYHIICLPGEAHFAAPQLVTPTSNIIYIHLVFVITFCSKDVDTVETYN